jgi:ABC-type enterochelin transport system substrate-binding protein
MKTKILFLMLFMPVFAQAKINVDSLKQKKLQPTVSDFVNEAVILVYNIKTEPDVERMKEYATELAIISDELKEKIKTFYPHAPYVDNKHPWESYADSIAEKANAIYKLCDRSPVKMQKQVEAVVEELREMEGI